MIRVSDVHGECLGIVKSIDDVVESIGFGKVSVKNSLNTGKAYHGLMFSKTLGGEIPLKLSRIFDIVKVYDREYMMSKMKHSLDGYEKKPTHKKILHGPRLKMSYLKKGRNVNDSWKGSPPPHDFGNHCGTGLPDGIEPYRVQED